MTIMLVLMAAASGVAAPADEEMMLPVGYGVVQQADIRVPISDSVRAATWDELEIPLDRPVPVRLACIIFVPSGGPGNCVPASLVPPGQERVDWDKILEARDKAERSTSRVDAALFKAAARRLKTLRLFPGDQRTVFSIRFFEEVVGPADARPRFAVAPEPALTTRNVLFAEPLDGRLLQMLYPAIAMRYSVNAQVRVTCDIGADLKLLCRDRGTVFSNPAEVPGYTAQLMEDLRFSTYQLASTIKLQPKTADGQDVAGRQFAFAVHWSLPK
ncbi:hypothetical protein [Sphingopyxis sp.]|jgi:hypothetical protein|uniref:hypothetical protein n=1 Tax=Sphingopyxis sp. TaxID=1908224 RepID=UPI002E02A24E|nr:hypothetical protein [Sphingopyxis sp.]